MMTNAAHHIRVAVEGLAREIGRRVGEAERERAKYTGDDFSKIPDGHDFGAALVARHAQAVLLDYLLGDFNPSKQADQ
jgi:hypothetical protein